MKILHIITEIDYGGAERLLLSLCKEQVSNSHSVDVVYLMGRSLLKKEFVRAGANLYLYDIARPGLLLSFVRLVSRIRRSRYDVIHTHLSHAAFIGRIAAMVAGHKNIVNTMHGNVVRWLQNRRLPDRVLTCIDQFLNNRKGSQTIAVSKAVRDFLLEREHGVNPERVRVVHNAIDCEELNRLRNQEVERDLFRISGREYIVTSIGRLSAEKGHIVLAKAVGEVVERRGIHDIKCFFIGEGPCRREIVQYIREHGLENNITLLGAQDNPYKYLKYSDLTVVPSLSEGFGMVVLEAYCCGVPVLASDVGGLAEIVRHGVTGVLVEKNNPEALADALLDFYRDRYDVAYMACSAKEFAAAHDIKEYAKKVEAVYRMDCSMEHKDRREKWLSWGGLCKQSRERSEAE